jgi:aminoglycoside 2'-N-acetyltransferase I
MTEMPSEHRDASECVLRVGHTAEVDAAVLGQARQLLEQIFEADWTAQDWEHALGGVHVLAFSGDLLVGHAAVVQRRLLYRGEALRTGYVEALGVHSAFRRAGIGGRMMEVLEGVIARAFELGALSATDVAAEFYAKRGWLQWQGPLSVLTPDGIRPTPEEASGVYVLPVTRQLDVHDSLSADWRDGDVW